MAGLVFIPNAISNVLGGPSLGGLYNKVQHIRGSTLLREVGSAELTKFQDQEFRERDWGPAELGGWLKEVNKRADALNALQMPDEMSGKKPYTSRYEFLDSPYRIIPKPQDVAKQDRPKVREAILVVKQQLRDEVELLKEAQATLDVKQRLPSPSERSRAGDAGPEQQAREEIESHSEANPGREQQLHEQTTSRGRDDELTALEIHVEQRVRELYDRLPLNLIREWHTLLHKEQELRDAERRSDAPAPKKRETRTTTFEGLSNQHFARLIKEADAQRAAQKQAGKLKSFISDIYGVRENTSLFDNSVVSAVHNNTDSLRRLAGLNKKNRDLLERIKKIPEHLRGRAFIHLPQEPLDVMLQKLREYNGKDESKPVTAIFNRLSSYEVRSLLSRYRARRDDAHIENTEDEEQHVAGSPEQQASSSRVPGQDGNREEPFASLRDIVETSRHRALLQEFQ